MNPNPQTFTGIRILEMSREELTAVLNIEKDCRLSAWSMANYEKEIERVDSICLVIKENSQTIGFLIMRLNNFREADIYNIGIAPEHQRKGIGSNLINESLTRAQKAGVEKIWLEVRRSNQAAINFYLRQGFLITAARKNFYSQPLEDALVMKYEFPSNE